LQADADASGGLRRAYREEIARLGFAPDAAQRAAVEHLERLRRELVIRDTRGRSLRARLLERVAPGSHPAPLRRESICGAPSDAARPG